MKYVLAWLALAVAFASITGSVNWLTYRQLAAHGVRAHGSVTDLLPKQHQFVQYEYDVGGRTYRDQAHTWPPNPSFADLSIGQPVAVYYDPAAPNRSVLGDPKQIFRHETVSVALAALVLPTVAILSWAWRERRNR